MRVTFRLMLVALAAVAAMAFSASSAFAVSVAVEGGATCDAVSPASGLPVHAHDVSGGCPIEATSEAKVELGAFGSMILCDNHFEAAIGGNGHGYIYAMNLTNCEGGTLVPCEEADEELEAWEVHLTSEATMEARFCVSVLASGEAGKFRCHLNNIQIEENPTHQYEFVTDNYPNHTNCEEAGLSVSGHWNQVINEDHPAVEIID